MYVNSSDIVRYSENPAGWAHERITTAATEVRDALKSFLATLKAHIAAVLPKVAEDKEEMKRFIKLFEDKRK